jgi:hypothetical protein
MQIHTRSRPWVAARLVAVCSTVLALAAGGHAAGGGALPSGLGLTLLVAMTTTFAAALAARPLRLTTLLPAVALWQWVLHQGFALTAAVGGGASGGAAIHGGHHGGGGVDPALLAPTADHAFRAAHQHGGSATMLLAHGIATLATVLLLVATERGAARAGARWAWAVPRLLTATAPVAAGPHRSELHVVGRIPALRALTHPGALGGRAPPRPALAA